MALTVADFLQTKSYSAAAMRRVALDSNLQPGVVGSTDFVVSQRAAGANLSVDVAIGSAWVKGGFTTRQGLYHAYNDAVVNLSIGANAIANPRVDSVVLRLYDTTDGGSGQDIAAVEVWQGTATASAQITAPQSANYRAGALATPAGASFIRLADILVPASSPASITNAMIVDRRPWARGAYWRTIRTAGNYTTSALTYGLLDSTNLYPRIECSGAPLKLKLLGRNDHNTLGHLTLAQPWLDGSAVDGTGDMLCFTHGGVSYASGRIHFEWEWTPSAGSHNVGFAWKTTNGTANIYATSAIPLVMTVEETVRQNANNG